MTIDSIQGIIRDLRDRGISILITDHQVRETLEITDRSYVIRGGQVLCHGRPRRSAGQSRSPQVLLRRGLWAGRGVTSMNGTARLSERVRCWQACLIACGAVLVLVALARADEPDWEACTTTTIEQGELRVLFRDNSQSPRVLSAAPTGS